MYLNGRPIYTSIRMISDQLFSKIYAALDEIPFGTNELLRCLKCMPQDIIREYWFFSVFVSLIYTAKQILFATVKAF